MKAQAAKDSMASRQANRQRRVSDPAQVARMRAAEQAALQKQQAAQAERERRQQISANWRQAQAAKPKSYDQQQAAILLSAGQVARDMGAFEKPASAAQLIKALGGDPRPGFSPDSPQQRTVKTYAAMPWETAAQNQEPLTVEQLRQRAGTMPTPARGTVSPMAMLGKSLKAGAIDVTHWPVQLYSVLTAGGEHDPANAKNKIDRFLRQVLTGDDQTLEGLGRMRRGVGGVDISTPGGRLVNKIAGPVAQSTPAMAQDLLITLLTAARQRL